ncbi:MAG: nucleotidyltransferase family protein [Synergistales bacterium]|nr:nucleotidyltransferase family protein [Synergistales bacterium]
MLHDAEVEMQNADVLLLYLKEHKQELRERFSVRRIGLFGSVLRGTAGPESDIDILVELERPSFDAYMDLKFYLEDIFGSPVDLVLRDSVKPRLKPIIESEVAYA